MKRTSRYQQEKSPNYVETAKGNDRHNVYVRGIVLDVQGTDVLDTDEVVIADLFNRYFVESIGEIMGRNDLCVEDEIWSVAGNEFNAFRTVEFGELSTIVNGLERKGGNQCLDNTFVKETYEVMGHCLLNFINTSLSYGRVPVALKTNILI
ncbi:hypothetical protein HHI36_000988 [Cryptolaemus montrouzieri]|uniref:Uncharacterized protein n=1 Tax=Cryptolaemus montrouzieri TaxID=559131 RepID=A0ABD2P6X8_9CUCU